MLTELQPGIAGMGVQTSDPFIDGRWDTVRTEAESMGARFVLFPVAGGVMFYVGLADLEQAMDPTAGFQYGFAVMGSFAKVNIVNVHEITPQVISFCESLLQ